MDITICIVDDNKDIRSALEQIILMSEGYRLIGSVGSAAEAMDQIPKLKPDIVLMDINLGEGENGIDCVRHLKSDYKDILFMMCTVYEDDEKIFEALSAGASGYILKKTAPHKLLEAIRELQEGGAPMSSQIARKVVAAFQQKQPTEAPTIYYAERTLEQRKRNSRITGQRHVVQRDCRQFIHQPGNSPQACVSYLREAAREQPRRGHQQILRQISLPQSGIAIRCNIRLPLLTFWYQLIV